MSTTKTIIGPVVLVIACSFLINRIRSIETCCLSHGEHYKIPQFRPYLTVTNPSTKVRFFRDRLNIRLGFILIYLSTMVVLAWHEAQPDVKPISEESAIKVPLILLIKHILSCMSPCSIVLSNIVNYQQHFYST